MSERSPSAGTMRLHAGMTPRERRHALLEIVLRRVKPGTGSGHNFLRRRDWSTPSMVLHELKTPFVIVGAVATRLYMPLRLTMDIDILVHERDRDRIAGELAALNCEFIQRLAIPGSRWRLPDGAELDVLESGEPWVEGAIAQPNRSPDGLPVIDLPHLVLMKLKSSRLQDGADISRMLGQASEDERARVRSIIARYLPQDLEDLEGLIVLGELEFRSPDGT